MGLGVAVLRHVLDTRVRNEDDVHAVTASPVLGVVAYDQEVSSHPVILRTSRWPLHPRRCGGCEPTCSSLI